MKKTRLTSLIGVIIIVFTLASCEGKDVTSKVINESLASMTEEISSKVSKPENYTISFMSPWEDDPYFSNIFAGCEKAVEELKKQDINVDLTYSKYTVDGKTAFYNFDAIKEEFSNGYDLILYYPRDYENKTHIEQFLKKNNKYIILYNEPEDGKKWDVSSSYYNDAYEMGVLAGEKMLEHLKENGKITGKIALLGANEMSTIVKLREEGFRSVFKDTAYELLDTYISEGDPSLLEEKSKQLIGEKVDGIYGMFHSATSVAGQVVLQNNKIDSIAVVGVDVNILELYKDDSALKLIKSGAIKTIINPTSFDVGYECIMGSVKVLRGEKIEPKINKLPPIVIDKDNIDNYYKEMNDNYWKYRSL